MTDADNIVESKRIVFFTDQSTQIKSFDLLEQASWKTPLPWFLTLKKGTGIKKKSLPLELILY